MYRIFENNQPFNRKIVKDNSHAQGWCAHQNIGIKNIPNPNQDKNQDGLKNVLNPSPAERSVINYHAHTVCNMGHHHKHSQ